ncbi:serine protease [Pseudonocardiaceae bacterium YIM PH 21723]|nr:serine protease [Pseudonocardiaceae bacterium YIM PH 21723]
MTPVYKKLALATAALALFGATVTLPGLIQLDTVAQADVPASLAGTVDVGDCSYSLVKLAGAKSTDKALILTAGHCIRGLAAADVMVDSPFTESGNPQVLDANGNAVTGVHRIKVLYATRSGTDMALYQAAETYGQLSAKRAAVLELSSEHPAAGTEIFLPSSFHRRSFECAIDGFVHQLKEGDRTWNDSIRYTTACKTEPGASGSPIVDKATGKVVGVHNTGNNGGRCTDDNPCEVDANGTVKVDKGRKYGQQTFQVYGCLGEGSTIDLTKSGCTLAKPKQ